MACASAQGGPAFLGESRGCASASRRSEGGVEEQPRFKRRQLDRVIYTRSWACAGDERDERLMSERAVACSPLWTQCVLVPFLGDRVIVNKKLEDSLSTRTRVRLLLAAA